VRALLLAAVALSLACKSVYERCGFQLLYLIPIGVNGRLDRVWTDLRNLAGRDVIGDVSLRESWKYAFIGTLYCSELVAKAYPKLNP
jgi:hypothetical protein